MSIADSTTALATDAAPCKRLDCGSVDEACQHLRSHGVCAKVTVVAYTHTRAGSFLHGGLAITPSQIAVLSLVAECVLTEISDLKWACLRFAHSRM